MKKLSRLTRVSLLLAILFGLDKLLSVVRQMLISKEFGLSAVLDVFNAANNLPDMLFMLISGGALAIAFIPILTEVLGKEGQQKAWDLFSNILNIGFLITAALAVVFAIFARPLIENVITPGFTEAQIDLATKLMRMNLISTLIFSLSGLVMAGLQANEHFLLPALAPVFYTLGQIFGALLLAPEKGLSLGPVTLPALGLGVEGLVYGVIIGAFLHLLIQVPGLIKYNYRWRPIVNFKEPYTRKVFKVMGPRLITMFLIQMVFLVQDNMASGLEEGAISALMYGYWIMQIPQTLLGTSVATAVLPTLSEFFNNERFDDFKEKIERATKVMLVLTIPIAVIAAVVVEPAVAVFIRGLDASGVARVVLVSRIFLAGIIGHSLVELFARSFYAQQKPFIPMLGAGLTLVIFVGVGFGLIALLPGWGIASEVGIVAANVLAYSAQAILLFILLNRELVNKLGTEKLQTVFIFGKAVLAAVLGGGLAFAAFNYLPRIQHTLIRAAMAGLIGVAISALVIRKELVYIRQL